MTESSDTRIGAISSPVGENRAVDSPALSVNAAPSPPLAICRDWLPGERDFWLWNLPELAPTAKLAAILARWRADPVVFAFEGLRTALMPYQAQALLDLADAPEEIYAFYGLDPSFPKRQVLLPSGHGLGKTRLMAIAIWWHQLTRRSSKRLCTAPTGDQLTGQLWGEVRKLYRLLDRHWPQLAAHWEIQTAAIVHKDPKWGDWVTVARTSRPEKPEGLQGAHALDEDDAFGDLAAAHNERNDDVKGGGMLVLIDEASGVDDAIREVLSGALSEEDARLLASGNPTRNDGWFARDVAHPGGRFAVHCLDCRMSNREQVYSLPYRKPGGPVVQVRIRGFVRPKYWEDLRAECDGDEDHDRFRVRVRGLIPRANEEQINRPEWIERAQAREPDHESVNEPVVVSLDFGLTGDMHGLAVRQGWNCLDIAEWLPPVAPDDVLNEAFRRGLDAVATWRARAPAAARIACYLIGDSNGVGAGVMGRFSDHFADDPRVLVVHFNAGRRAHDAERYHRRRDEMWHRYGRRWLADPRCSLPQHPGLRNQLTAPACTEDTAKKIKVETKDAIFKRTGRKSGNAADALLQSLMVRTEVVEDAPPKAPVETMPKIWREHYARLDRQRRQGVFIR